MADKFRTRDEPLTGLVCYELTMPGALWFIAELSDLLRDMCLAENWQQVGTVTIDEATSAATAMYLGMRRMIGTIFPYTTSALPDNCLACDGAQYARVDYPDLYAALDSAFIVDVDTFTVPDLRDKTIIGASATNSTGSTGGEAEHTLTTAELPAHNHTDTGHQHTTGNSLSSLAVMPGEGPVLVPNPIPALTGTASANISNTGSGDAHNNLPPYLCLKYAMVAR